MHAMAILKSFTVTQTASHSQRACNRAGHNTHALAIVVLSPDPTLCKGNDPVSVFLVLVSSASELAQHFVYVQANQIVALRFSSDIASCCEAMYMLYKVSCLWLGHTNLIFCFSDLPGLFLADLIFFN